jgi:hypothetical protein
VEKNDIANLRPDFPFLRHEIPNAPYQLLCDISIPDFIEKIKLNNSFLLYVPDIIHQEFQPLIA